MGWGFWWLVVPRVRGPCRPWVLRDALTLLLSYLCPAHRTFRTTTLPPACRNISWPEGCEEVSAECRDLVDRLLTLDPKQRLGHRWATGRGGSGGQEQQCCTSVRLAWAGGSWDDACICAPVAYVPSSPFHHNVQPSPPPSPCRGAGEVKLHPWFAGVDWASLARQKVAFVPQPDCDTDTSYFSSKPVSQRSLALDLDSSRSDMLEVGAAGLAGLGATSASLSPLPSSSLPTSRSHSRAGSKRASTRRRSLRHALAEPSGASWSELRSHSSGASSGSRGSLAGGSDMGVEPSPGSVVRAAADLLQRQAAGGGEQLSRLAPQQRPVAAVAPTRSSTVLSGCDLPAGEPRDALDGEEEELFSSAAGSTRMGSVAGLATSRTMEIEIEDAASVSGSPMGSGDEGEYSSVEGGGGGGSFSSASGSSGSRPSPGFRGFSYTNVALLEEQNLEALRWVGWEVGWVGAGGVDCPELHSPGGHHSPAWWGGGRAHATMCSELKEDWGCGATCAPSLVSASRMLRRAQPHPPPAFPTSPPPPAAATSTRTSSPSLTARPTWRSCAPCPAPPRPSACPPCRPPRRRRREGGRAAGGTRPAALAPCRLPP